MQIVLMILAGIFGIVIGNQIRKKMNLKYKPIYPNGLISFVAGVAIPVSIAIFAVLLLTNLHIPSTVGTVVFSAVKGLNFGIVFGIFFF